LGGSQNQEQGNQGSLVPREHPPSLCDRLLGFLLGPVDQNLLWQKGEWIESSEAGLCTGCRRRFRRGTFIYYDPGGIPDDVLDRGGSWGARWCQGCGSPWSDRAALRRAIRAYKAILPPGGYWMAAKSTGRLCRICGEAIRAGTAAFCFPGSSAVPRGFYGCINCTPNAENLLASHIAS